MGAPLPRPPTLRRPPSPPSLPGGEVAGAEVVRELPADLALPVWQALRLVLAWAGTPPAKRGALFDAAAMRAWEEELLRAGWEAELRLPLAVVAGALADPATASPERLAWGCLCVTEWALAAEAPDTALAFAEAAARCWPEHPRYAYVAGRLLRGRSRLAEAEAWFHRALRTARRTGDAEAEGRALVGLGNTYLDLGKYRVARQIQSRAVTLARRRALREIAGMAFHDLFAISIHEGRHAEAEAFARDACREYGAGHALLPSLAHDVAYSWMEQGYFQRALGVLCALVPHFTAPDQRIRVRANAARAAGAVGARELFDHLWREVMETEGRSVGAQASAWVELALGALSLGDCPRAERALTEAVRLSEARSETSVLLRAETVRDSIASRRAVEKHARVTRGAPSPADTLAREFVLCLTGGAGDTLPGPPEWLSLPSPSC